MLSDAGEHEMVRHEAAEALAALGAAVRPAAAAAAASPPDACPARASAARRTKSSYGAQRSEGSGTEGICGRQLTRARCPSRTARRSWSATATTPPPRWRSAFRYRSWRPRAAAPRGVRAVGRRAQPRGGRSADPRARGRWRRRARWRWRACGRARQAAGAMRRGGRVQPGATVGPPPLVLSGHAASLTPY